MTSLTQRARVQPEEGGCQMGERRRHALRVRGEVAGAERTALAAAADAHVGVQHDHGGLADAEHLARAPPVLAADVGQLGAERAHPGDLHCPASLAVPHPGPRVSID